MTVLVDSNVILDILTNDRNWFDWSALQLTTYARQGDDGQNISTEVSNNRPQQQQK